MSTIFVNRFVSSVYNEKIKIDDGFNLGDILTVNKSNDDTLPNNTSPIESYNFPTNKDTLSLFKYELDRYVRGNVQLVTKEMFQKTDSKDDDKKLEQLRRYALRNLIVDKLFDTTYKRIIGKAKRTIFLFPVYDNPSNGSDKLLDELEENYKWIFSDLPNFITEPIRFYLNDLSDETVNPSTKPYIDKIQDIQKLKISNDQFKKVYKQPFNHLLFPNNAIIFLPIINPTEDVTTFESRMSNFLLQVRQSIENESKVGEGQLIREEKIPFTSISYSVINDKENEMFTDYYKDKLGSKKKKILKKLLDDFLKPGSTIGKQSIQINNTIKNAFQIVTTEQIEKDFNAFTRSLYSNFINNDKYLTLKDDLIKLINRFKDYSKRSESLEYAISVASDTTANFLRVFYRVNNMDIPVNVDLIRTGANYLYKLEGIELNRIDEYAVLSQSASLFKEKGPFIYVGFLYKNVRTAKKNTFRFQVHILKTIQLRKLTRPNVSDDNIEDEDAEDHSQDQQKTDQKSVMLELMKNKMTGEITFQKAGSREHLKGFGLNFKGNVEEYENLHIYEKYRWFKFNHIDGSLSDETNIRFFPDILFDRKTFIEYLKSKKTYDEKKTRLPYEFLKINKDMEQLNEYSTFIQDNYKSSHTYKPSLLGRFTSSKTDEKIFENSIKSGILDIIFTPINVIYIGKPPSKTIGDKDTSKNYKIVSYQEHKPSGFNISINENDNLKYYYGDFYEKTLQQVISGEDPEYKYCDKHKLDKCEIMKEFFTTDYLSILSKESEKIMLEEQLKYITGKNDKETDIRKKQNDDKIQKLNDDIEKTKKGVYSKNIDKTDKKKYINDDNQHICMALVTVTQENINSENFNSFLQKSRCKILRKNIKYDLKSVRAAISTPLIKQLTINGGNLKKNITKKKNSIKKIKKNNKKHIIFKKINKKIKKIKPFNYTKIKKRI
jgi:hypothetical protein